MSHNLQDLIRGNTTVQDFVSDEALTAAFNKRNKEREEVMTDSLVSVIDNFSDRISGMQKEAIQLQKEATAALERFNAAEVALRYFGATRNPLPLYRAMGMVEEGTRWLRSHGLDVPCIRDKSSAWYIQSDAQTGGQGEVTVVE